MVPLQYEGPYRLKKPFSGAPKKVDPQATYLRSGSRIVIAGEREKHKMDDWATWFWDGRYVSSHNELEQLIKKSVVGLRSIDRCGEYFRFTAVEPTIDRYGSRERLILGHAYVKLEPLSEAQICMLSADSLQGTHDRWIIAADFHIAAKELATREGIRTLKVNDLYIGKDIYAKYCTNYLEWWKKQRAADGIGTVSQTWIINNSAT